MRTLIRPRALFPAASRRWDAPARRAIEAASAAFAPDWELPAGEFSDWHYMLVEPGTERFEGPLVVLHDTDCFSATDIFLGAFQGVPGVTLVGTPSGGGSGRSRGQELLHSGLSVRLSSMASFRPDGSRYDGKGVAPDVLVLPAPEDFLEGGGDRQLEAALELLLR